MRLNFATPWLLSELKAVMTDATRLEQEADSALLGGRTVHLVSTLRYDGDATKPQGWQTCSHTATAHAAGVQQAVRGHRKHYQRLGFRA